MSGSVGQYHFVPRPVLTDEEWAYFAGFFDGEGNVGVYKQGKKLVLRLAVAGTHEHSIRRWLIMGGNVYQGKPKPRHKDKWTWYAYGTRAKYALDGMLPFLNVKRPQADLALMFPIVAQANRTRHTYGYYTPFEYDEKQRIRNEMLALNKRGK